MKFILFTLLLTLSTAAHSQSTLDSLRADVLTEAANALRIGDLDEAAIWLAVAKDIDRPDFKEEVYDKSFLEMLDMHIKFETPLKQAALKIRRRVRPSRM